MAQLKMPQRQDYESEIEYGLACSVEMKRYQKELFREIDKVPEIKSQKPKTATAKAAARAETVHEYLQRKPKLLERYKRLGPIALLMLGDD